MISTTLVFFQSRAFLGEYNVIEIVTRIFTEEKGVEWRIYFECLFEWLMLRNLGFEKKNKTQF